MRASSAPAAYAANGAEALGARPLSSASSSAVAGRILRSLETVPKQRCTPSSRERLTSPPASIPMAGRIQRLGRIPFANHHRIKHQDDTCAEGGVHINGTENFWTFSKRRLARFNGVPSASFPFFLKECEFRFNHRHDDLYHLLLESSSRNPLGSYPGTDPCFLTEVSRRQPF
jgi:hypothetical protein